MLYPDNPKHCKAIDYLDLLDNSLYVKHIAKYDDDNKMINKEHWHCILKFNNGYWLSSLLKDLGLDEEDAHLFHSYKDFKDHKNKQKFKTLEDYASYLDHIMNDDKEDKYDVNDFKGGLISWFKGIINKRENSSLDNFIDMINFIRSYNLDNFLDTRTFTFQDWFILCVNNGYGVVFWNNWYKMRDILKSYINS